MAQVTTNEVKSGMKVEVDGEPYVVTGNEFFNPGKGQPVNRIKIKHLKTGRVIEKTYKAGDKLLLADVEDIKMRMLYREQDGVVFMNEIDFEQITISDKLLSGKEQWLREEVLYDITLYKGEPIDVNHPTFMEMTVVETAPGLRGDTSGRVLKSALTDTGAKVQIPIFVEQGEKIKVDTRTGEYVSRL